MQMLVISLLSEVHVVEEMMNNTNTSGSQYSSYYNNHTILEYTNTEMSWKML